MKQTRSRIVAALASITMMLAGQSTRAITINGGIGLLTPGGGAWLEAQLGEGPLALTSIFTHAPGDGLTSIDFHAAADGQGRTFVILEALTGTGTEIIGGYNPQSWNSSGGYNVTPNLADHTAAIFNLTDLRWQTQISDVAGNYQTFNHSELGPMFGGGDIFVESNLSDGYIYPSSYGGGPDWINILGGVGPFGHLDSDGDGISDELFDFGRMEIFTLAPDSNGGSSVPDAGATASLLGLSFLGLTLFKRKLQPT